MSRLQAGIEAADGIPPSFAEDGGYEDPLEAGIARMESLRFLPTTPVVDDSGSPPAEGRRGTSLAATGRRVASRLVGPTPGRLLRRMNAFLDEITIFNRTAARRIGEIEKRVAELERGLAGSGAPEPD